MFGTNLTKMLAIAPLLLSIFTTVTLGAPTGVHSKVSNALLGRASRY